MGMFRLDWLHDIIGPRAGVGQGDPERGALVIDVDDSLAAGPILLAYATQTGVAEDLSGATREQLLAAGFEVDEIDFDALSLPKLEAASQVLFVASTTCDGDPPDMAETFAEQAMRQPAALAHLRYGLLALGDRAYEDFCGFGRTLDAWLLASGAQAWFPRIDVDDEDAAALDRWHAQIAALAAVGNRQSQNEGVR